MTSPAVPASPSGRFEGAPSAGPGRAPARPVGRRPSPWLWAAGLLVLIPTALPIGALFVRVLGASGDAASVLFSQRTLELLVRSALLTALVTLSAIVVGVGYVADLAGLRTTYILSAILGLGAIPFVLMLPRNR